MNRLCITLAAGLLLVGCTTPRTEYVQTPLPLPERPDVPTIPAEQLRCLSDEAYNAIVERDQAKTEHIEVLENVIRTTRENKSQGE